MEGNHGKSPELNGGLGRWENHRIKRIVYLAMFDYRRVPNNKWEFVVDIC
jgi:hypothetical protein